MGRFLPLLELIVEHGFFQDGLCMRLDFAAAEAARGVIDGAGMLIRQVPGGIRLFYEEDRRELLDSPFAAGEQLAFRVYSGDPLFMNYTRPPVWGDGRVLFFANAENSRESDGTVILHREEFASAADLRRLDAPETAAALRSGDRLVRPSFLVSLSLQGTVPREGESPRRFLIRFRARETYWKYYLALDLPEGSVTISDRNGKVSFESLGEEILANRRKALVFRSVRPLPLGERPSFNFQLRESGAAGGRLLMRRLPVPSAQQLFKEVVDGNEADISEVYVNC